MRSITRNKKKPATVICLGDCSGSVLLKVEAKIMKENGLYRTTTRISLTKAEFDAMYKVHQEYNICVPILALHVLLETSIMANDKKRMFKYGIYAKANVIIRKDLCCYLPFESNNAGKYDVPATALLDIPYVVIKEKLNSIGILDSPRFLLAITRVLIQCPDEAVSMKVKGVHPKRYFSPYAVGNYDNKPFKTTARLNPDVIEYLDRIAEKAHSNTCVIMTNALKVLCDMEFNNENHVENSYYFRRFIVGSVKTTVFEKRCNRKLLNIYISDIKYSVQILELIERYGIPGKTELISRVANFIIQSHNGDISLNHIHVNDDSDYNETRMIRNEFRKEVLYASR